jgi:hypothetical protein
MNLYIIDRAPQINVMFASYFVFIIIAGRFSIRDRHQRAWIMSAFATTLLSLFGIVEVIMWVMRSQTALSFGSTVMSNTLIDFLKSYLFIDMIYSTFWHPERFGMFEGWIHHLIYIMAAEKLQQNYLVNIAQPFWIMEIPMAIRAVHGLGSITRATADRWFAPTFVAFRIVWPAYVITQIVAQDWVFYFIGGGIILQSWWAFTHILR